MSKTNLVSHPDDIQKNEKVVVYYDEKGEIGDEKTALAKTESSDQSIKYFIMKDGMKIVDIMGDHYTKRNRFKWVWVGVSKQCFESYLNYLKTHKKVCLSNATRMFHNH